VLGADAAVRAVLVAPLLRTEALAGSTGALLAGRDNIGGSLMCEFCEQRKALQVIREEAINHHDKGSAFFYQAAWLDLARAADRLDAMLARDLLCHVESQAAREEEDPADWWKKGDNGGQHGI
jgi:hypothetical protein